MVLFLDRCKRYLYQLRSEPLAEMLMHLGSHDQLGFRHPATTATTRQSVFVYRLRRYPELQIYLGWIGEEYLVILQ